MYRINDIFSSLQGEGHNTGCAATFVRFAGCNLRCSFCDTDFSEYREMSADEIVKSISVYPTRFVVLTGGEPSLQVDDTLVDALHDAGFTIAMETNGSKRPAKGIDWITVSPKIPFGKYNNSDNIDIYREIMEQANEIKVVFDGEHTPDTFLPPSLQSDSTEDAFMAKRRKHDLPLLYLQPCDIGDPERNGDIMRACINYITEHPQWRLSLQTHKLANFK
ncbi:MAG: 7-carboxy-7-deazaguanine synthase QueE [Prevotella koreensis]|uniref:7-carboxy-7-deazaguanine synthase QueE n=1 Tax=Prevotella koreensis TaxID=2490854 RepID=UPI003F9F56C5